jgi:uncharacterized protein YcnI
MNEGRHTPMSSKAMSVGLAAGVAALLLAAPAGAHITTDPAGGPADGFATIGFQVPHGCDDSPTTRIRIQIPRNVPSVTPGRNAFWDLTTKEGPKDEVELHGETITRGVSEVIYTAKQPLPPHELDVLPLSLKLPAGEPGDVVRFPTIQECAEGRTAWIQIPAEGESEDDLESPAPAVVLAAAGDAHGAEPAVDVEPAASTPADDDGAPVWLVVVALALGAAGLLAGIGGLLRGGR